MSELDLLADCLKDATKERDELADALEQAQNVVDAASTSVNIDRRDDLVKWFQRLAITLDALTAGDCNPHDFINRGDGTARCKCGEQVDISETGAARRGSVEDPNP